MPTVIWYLANGLLFSGADIVNETGDVDNPPVCVVTAFNTYHEQPLPVEDPDAP